MQVKLFESNDLTKLQDTINDFIKDVYKCEVSITYGKHKYGVYETSSFIACVLYKK